MNSLPLISHRLYVAALGQPRKEPASQVPRPPPTDAAGRNPAAGNRRDGIKADKAPSELLYAPALTT